MLAKKLRFVFFWVMLISLILTGCLSSNPENITEQTKTESAKNTPKPGTDPGQKFIVYNGGSFKINVPESWMVEDKNNYSVDVVFKAPGSGENADEFLPTVNVLVSDSKGISDFNKYIDDVINNLRLNYMNFSLADRKSVDENAVALVYNGSLSGYNVSCKQVIRLKNGKIYITTYVSENKSFEKYLEIADKMMDSLEF